MPPRKAAPLGAKSGAIKRPKFGGKPKTQALPPDKKALESLGGGRSKMPAFEPRVAGQRETGFIQATPKQATGAMMGRSPPGLVAGGRGKLSTTPRKDKQFRPKGKKVF